MIGTIATSGDNSPATQTGPLVASQPPASTSSSGISFGDVLDALNPLQHIPVVSSIYRAATGSQISGASQIAGDTLYGGVLGVASAVMGFASSAANVAVKQITGEDIGQHVMGAANAAASAIASPFTSSTQLVPSAATAVTPASSTGTISAQLSNAAQAIYRTSSQQHFQHTSAQYQRAQAFDTINKNLVKMGA